MTQPNYADGGWPTGREGEKLITIDFPCTMCGERSINPGKSWCTLPHNRVPVDPTCAIHGMKWSEHEHGRCLYCSLCFTALTPEECWTDKDGQKWDLCQECGAAEELAKQTMSQALD